MTTLEIIIIALGLAMDASAVSLAAAAAGFAPDARAKFRLSFHFGLFQFLMPVAGWFMGISFVSHFKAFDHWIAFFLLAFVGIRMIWEGMGSSAEVQKKDPSRGMTMVMLSVATSIDAQAIGLSLALLEVNIWYPSIMIGVITTGMSLLAIRIGTGLGALFGKRMEIFGGMVLLLIGSRILFSHLTSMPVLSP
jgi:putative Mn2+ efflux pump MntP